MKLGKLLIDAGLVTQDQIRQALEKHKKGNLKLGQILVREGFVNESQVVELLSQQYRIKRYHPEKFAIDLNLSKIVPAEMAKKYQLAPLNISDNVLKIVMIDPLDIDAADQIERYTKIEVETVICTEKDLITLQKSFYGSFSGIDDVLQGIGDMQIDNESDRPTTTEDVEVSELHGMAEEAPVVRLVNSIISQAIQEGASDVHISPQKDYIRVRFRIDGKLHDMPTPPKGMLLPMVSRLKILADMDIAVSRIPQDGRFNVKMKNRDINIRAATIPSLYGENIVLRLLDTSKSIYTFDRLGMTEADQKKIESILIKPYGMILCTGPTGSGKTTSLYSILRKINQPDTNIITVEDPVEYRLENILQVQLNRKAGMTFASGLRAILRQDPDVIMVGEIRDFETAQMAIQAALTGHLVLSTLHTNNAAGALVRLIDMGIEPFLVASAILAAFAQRLLRRICPYCKEIYEPPIETLDYWKFDFHNNGSFARGRGCFDCMHTGYKDRTGVYEVLIIDEVIRSLILQRKSAQEITRYANNSVDFMTIEQNVAEMIKRGITTIEEAVSAVII